MAATEVLILEAPAAMAAQVVAGVAAHLVVVPAPGVADRKVAAEQREHQAARFKVVEVAAAVLVV
jgi:hypothetical protein